MLTLFRQDERLRALGAGILYVLLSAILAHVRWHLEGRLTTRQGRAKSARPWAWGLELIGLILAVGYPLLLSLVGAFSPADLGFRDADWRQVLPIALIGALGAHAWLALLWWRERQHAPTSCRPGTPEATPAMRGPVDVGAFAFLSAARDEGCLATCRAAIIPLLGNRWGVWLAIILRMLASVTSPHQQIRLRDDLLRRRVYSDWALDCVSTAVFVLTQTIVATFIVRTLCRVLLDLTVLRPAASAREQVTSSDIRGTPPTMPKPNG